MAFGEITKRSAGKTVAYVLACRNILEINFTDNSCVRICLRDDDSGKALEGTFDVLFEGTLIRAKHAQLAS